jgi:hypothetical protein
VANPDGSDANRRQFTRFPIEREVRYTTLNKRGGTVTGVGKTVNISSFGVLLRAEHQLAVGTRLKASISWPIVLKPRGRSNLIVEGSVVRAEGCELALRIERYRIHVAGRSSIGDDVFEGL